MIRMTSTKVAELTGIHRSVINKWVMDGLLTPRGGPSIGRGYAVDFDTDDVARLRAIAAVKREFGDGALACQIIAATVPRITAHNNELILDGIRLTLL